MEVHTHHSNKAPGKKWAHYLWEFFMLFLAVTLGFFVENQREHYVEHAREKQFMTLMIADLQTDIAEMNTILQEVEVRALNVDSMLQLLTSDPTSNQAVVKSYRYTYPALNNITFSFNDRTITQLKNSGNMRIIRNQKVNDGIIDYWNHIENVKQALSRHMSYRTTGRELETKIYNVAEMYLRNNRRVDVSSDISLIPHSAGLVKEYANIVASSGIMLSSLRAQITAQHKLAVQLLELIKKEYHLSERTPLEK
ncbi:MAG TPA: hypothetical protein VFD24_08495 [Chitinophagaceae bacterium]|jgi:hypothetical protein|nr:hypothetical protein [Chitinophagaceae bacterium]